MYFPYLRGKQFELIAIRELAPLIGEGKISPIVEPVKQKINSLEKAINDLAREQSNFTIVVNPSVGDFKHDHKELISTLNHIIPIDYANFQFGVLIDNRNNYEEIYDELNQLQREVRNITLVHHVQRPIGEETSPYNENLNVKYNIINSSLRRYDRRFEANTIALLDDPFTLMDRNADYLELGEELFTEEHKYYGKDGFAGFSDYTTIGASWMETGFQPWAVSIHLTYLENNTVKIRHFTSESNEDTEDVAGKFAEAVAKLYNFIQAHPINTRAVGEFVELHNRGHYPGLGIIKKLSIQNHLEIINSVL